MSSQGSVNAPVAPQGTATQEQVSAQRPTEQVGIPVEWKPWKPVTTQLSGVAGPTRTHSQCGMRPGNSDRNVVHYTGYNPGTHRTDNGNWNELK